MKFIDDGHHHRFLPSTTMKSIIILSLMMATICSSQFYSSRHHHRHRQPEGWNVMDWWHDNIREDLYTTFNQSIDSLVADAPMGRFVQLKIDNDDHDLQSEESSQIIQRRLDDDLDMAESSEENVSQLKFSTTTTSRKCLPLLIHDLN